MPTQAMPPMMPTASGGGGRGGFAAAAASTLVGGGVAFAQAVSKAMTLPETTRALGVPVTEFRRGLGPVPESAADADDEGGTVPVGGHRRRASVRWFRRMNPERIFPLTVVLAKARIAVARVQDVSHAVSAEMLVIPETSPIVLVRPVLAGCQCFPPEQRIDVTNDPATARFRVLPQLVGPVEDARIELYSGDRLLSQIPLQIDVCKQTVAQVCSAAAVAWPFLSGKMGGDTSALTAMASDLMATPMVPEMGLTALGIAAVWSYLANRPQEAGQETDVLAVRPLSAGELIADGRKALAEGKWTSAAGLFEDAVNVEPDNATARAGLIEARRRAGSLEVALEAADEAVGRGAADGEVLLQRAVCLAILKRPDEAISAAEQAVRKGLPSSRITAEPEMFALRRDRRMQTLAARK
jgi:hypothetical protein